MAKAQEYIKFADERVDLHITLSVKDSDRTGDDIHKKEKVINIISIVLLYAVVAVLTLIFILPFFLMFATSLASNTALINSTGFYSEGLMWSNYSYVIAQAGSSFPFLRFVLNTVLVGILTVLGTLLTSILAGFAFGRLKFKGKNIAFLVLVAASMIPEEMLFVTDFATMSSFGLVGSNQNFAQAVLAMILPFWVSVFSIYMLKQHISQIPEEYYKLAKADGKSDIEYLIRVVIPMVMPTLITIAILTFISTWNSYVWPSLVDQNVSYRLVNNGLRDSLVLLDSNGSGFIGYQMAAAMLITIPLFALFIPLRKFIMMTVKKAGFTRERS